MSSTLCYFFSPSSMSQFFFVTIITSRHTHSHRHGPKISVHHRISSTTSFLRMCIVLCVNVKLLLQVIVSVFEQVA